MALVVKYDPEVKPYYDRYKQYQKQAFHSMIWAFGWAAIAALLTFVAAFSADRQWGFAAAVDMMLAMYWLNSARIEEARADLVRHEFVQYAKSTATEQVYEEMFKPKKEVTNGENTTKEGRGRR